MPSCLKPSGEKSCFPPEKEKNSYTVSLTKKNNFSPEKKRLVMAKPFLQQISRHKQRRENNWDQTQKLSISQAPDATFNLNDCSIQME